MRSRYFLVVWALSICAVLAIAGDGVAEEAESSVTICTLQDSIKAGWLFDLNAGISFSDTSLWGATGVELPEDSLGFSYNYRDNDIVALCSTPGSYLVYSIGKRSILLNGFKIAGPVPKSWCFTGTSVAYLSNGSAGLALEVVTPQGSRSIDLAQTSNATVSDWQPCPVVGSTCIALLPVKEKRRMFLYDAASGVLKVLFALRDLKKTVESNYKVPAFSFPKLSRECRSVSPGLLFLGGLLVDLERDRVVDLGFLHVKHDLRVHHTMPLLTWLSPTRFLANEGGENSQNYRVLELSSTGCVKVVQSVIIAASNHFNVREPACFPAKLAIHGKNYAVVVAQQIHLVDCADGSFTNLKFLQSWSWGSRVYFLSSSPLCVLSVDAADCSNPKLTPLSVSRDEIVCAYTGKKVLLTGRKGIYWMDQGTLSIENHEPKAINGTAFPVGDSFIELPKTIGETVHCRIPEYAAMVDNSILRGISEDGRAVMLQSGEKLIVLDVDGATAKLPRNALGASWFSTKGYAKQTKEGIFAWRVGSETPYLSMKENPTQTKLLFFSPPRCLYTQNGKLYVHNSNDRANNDEKHPEPHGYFPEDFPISIVRVGNRIVLVACAG